jgi:purine nucleoside phosphorylase
MDIAVIVGSAFGDLGRSLEPVPVVTPFGAVTLHRASRGWVVFRHGRPHHLLPHQVPYRALITALRDVGVGSLVSTSSVGVLQPDLPLFTPMLVGDVAWFDMRLPDGTAATLWPEPVADQGHLVLEHGLLDERLGAAIRALATTAGVPLHPDPVDFWYAPGPRTKTRLENRLLASWGLQVNSMTLAPELVLAGEAGISAAAVVVGHKASGPGMGRAGVERSLVDAREAMERLVHAVLDGLEAVPARNPVYRFG